MCKDLDLREVDDPDSGFTLRRLWVAYDHLPGKNEVNRELLGMNPMEYEEMWQTTNAQLADLIDAMQYNTFVLIKANSDKHSTVKQPKPYPRPTYGKKEEPKKKVNPLAGLPTIRVSKEG